MASAGMIVMILLIVILLATSGFVGYNKFLRSTEIEECKDGDFFIAKAGDTPASCEKDGDTDRTCTANYFSGPSCQ